MKDLTKLFISEEKTEKEILDTLPVAIYINDKEGLLKYYNSAASKLSGGEPQLGTDQWFVTGQLYHPDGTPMPYDECPMAVSLQEGRCIHGAEMIAERLGGERIWFKAYSAPLHNNGEIIGCINMLVDITDQKQAEKEFRRNEKELNDFFENATVGIHWVRSDGIIKRVNQAELDMLGYSREEFVGSPISEFHADQEEIEDILQKLAAGEKLDNREVRMKCKDGTIRHVLVSSSVYREDGEFIHTRCISLDVTKRKKTQEELKSLTAESEQQKRLYEAIISSTPDLVFVFDLNYRFTFANDALLEMWGRTREESIGKSLLEIGYEPWHAEMHEREIDQAIATKQPVQGEVSFPHDKLGQRIYDYILVPVIDDNGTVEAVAGTTRDVTERKMVEEARRKSEEKYRSLFEKMDEGFCILKMQFDENENPIDWRYLETNSAFEEHTGLKNAEGKFVSNLLPELEKDWFEKYGKVALTGEPVQFEDYTDELDRWFEISAFRIGEPEEQKVAVLFNNITERKKAREKREQLLREVENERKRLSEIFKHAPSFMCILRGPDHVFERANDLYMQLIGKDREVIGKPAREVFPEVEGQGFFELLDQVYETGEPAVMTDTPIKLNRQPDSEQGLETRYLDLVYQPLRDSDGSINGIFAQGVDLTERRQAKEELKAMNETLEERVKDRTKSLLSYQDQLRSLASQLNKAEENQRQKLATELHDNLGQLLAMGKMKIDLLPKDKFSDKTSEELTELKEVIDEALTYTRELMSELKPPPSINEDIGEGIKWVAEKLEKHGLEINLNDDGQPKPLDEEVKTTVLQSVRELLFNVIKHTSEKEAMVSLKSNGDELQITVEDKGKGFYLEDGELTPAQEGGFGLFNIQERIDLLGGRVDIETKPGKGTKITLYIPLAEESKNGSTLEQAGEAGQGKTTRTQTKTGVIKVLLVDDHQMVREGLRKVIDEQDDIMIIGEAGDGEEAVELSRKTYPDIVLMDVNMPKMDGIQATRRITGEMPHIRVIGLSLYDEDRVIKNIRSAGASAYLTKTEAFESLVETIRAEASTLKKQF
jgi:PAS domain S-box-containing protein